MLCQADHARHDDHRHRRVATLNGRAAVIGLALLALACSGNDIDTAASGASTSTVIGAPITSTTNTSRTTTTAPAAVTTAVTSSSSSSSSSSTVDPALATAACLAQLPAHVSAGQVVWPAVYVDELDDRAPQFANWGVGGAVLMSWTDTAGEASAAATASLTALTTAGTVPLLIATDEEGGAVQRMRSLGTLPDALDVAVTLTPDEAEAMIADHAATLRDIGIDIVYAPVVDIGPAGAVGTGPIGRRVFADDPSIVTSYAEAYVRGWLSAGITPVLKHFPGHGSASADSHLLTAATPPLDELRARDLVPYSALNMPGVAVMVGHLTVPGLDDTLPTSLSPAAYQLLRNEYGYADALVFTDALGMSAITQTYDIPTAAALAIAAGADVAIFTDTDATPQVIAAIVDAVDAGIIPRARLDDAAGRVLQRKGIDPCLFVED